MKRDHSEENVRANFETLAQALANEELKIFQAVELKTGRLAYLVALVIETNTESVVVPLGELYDRPRPHDFQLITSSGNGAVH